MSRHIEVGTEVVAKVLYSTRDAEFIPGTKTRYGKDFVKIPVGTLGVVEDVGVRQHFQNTWKVYLVRFDGYDLPLWVAASDIAERGKRE